MLRRIAPSARNLVGGAHLCEHGVALGPVSELARRKRTVVSVGKLELLVIFHCKRFTVVENRCPHAGAALDDAHVTRRTLTCAAHSYRYALGGGACVAGPRRRGGEGGCLRTLPTREAHGCLYVTVDASQWAG